MIHRVFSKTDVDTSAVNTIGVGREGGSVITATTMVCNKELQNVNA